MENLFRYRCSDRHAMLCSTVHTSIKVEGNSAFVTASMINLSPNLKGRKPKKLISMFDSPIANTAAKTVSLFRRGKAQDEEDTLIIHQSTTQIRKISTSFVGRALSTLCACFAAEHMYLSRCEPPESQVFFYHFMQSLTIRPHTKGFGLVLVLEGDNEATFLSMKDMNLISSGVLLKINGLGSQNNGEERVELIYEGHIYRITIGLSDLINTKKRPIFDDLLHLMIWDDLRSRTVYNEDVFSAAFNTYVDDRAIPSPVVWSMLKKAASLGLGHGLLKCLSGILVTRLNQTFEIGFAAVQAELNLPT